MINTLKRKWRNFSEAQKDFTILMFSFLAVFVIFTLDIDKKPDNKVKLSKVDKIKTYIIHYGLKKSCAYGHEFCADKLYFDYKGFYTEDNLDAYNVYIREFRFFTKDLFIKIPLNGEESLKIDKFIKEKLKSQAESKLNKLIGDL
jgi:hypothetical protein